MSERHKILEDKEFWTRLEYAATRWLEESQKGTQSRFWVDGFLPDSATDTERGVDVKGTAFVGEGTRTQHQYRFIVSVPQKMLDRRERVFQIEELSLNVSEETLQIKVSDVGGENLLPQ
jgi:hypothetical protein